MGSGLRSERNAAWYVRSVSTATFSVVFAVTKVDDKNVELFTTTLTVSQVTALGVVENGKLSIGDP